MRSLQSITFSKSHRQPILRALSWLCQPKVIKEFKYISYLLVLMGETATEQKRRLTVQLYSWLPIVPINGLCSVSWRLSWRDQGSDPKCSYPRLSRQLFQPMIILTCGQERRSECTKSSIKQATSGYYFFHPSGELLEAKKPK